MWSLQVKMSLFIEISQGGIENQVGIGPNVHLDVANITVDSFLVEQRRFTEWRGTSAELSVFFWNTFFCNQKLVTKKPDPKPPAGGEAGQCTCLGNLSCFRATKQAPLEIGSNSC